jgi:BirA family transcriptional regulator, biotin operon repressor / biotin---[acetyl-CoA-carboxylase] ligase
MLFLFAMYLIHFLESIPSTNTLAKKPAENGALHGTAVIGANQTEGRRRRLGKNWHSVAGKALYCSATQDFHKITLAARLGVAQALDHISAASHRLNCRMTFSWMAKNAGEY